MKCNSPVDRRRGVTILEVVIVFFVLLFLAAMMLPTTRGARQPARRAECDNNLKQIGLALHTYVDQGGVLPPAIIYSPDSSETPKELSLGTTGWLLLLPFVDKQGLYDQYDFNQGAVPGSIGPSLANQKITSTRMKIYTCPSDQVPSLASNATAPGICMNASTSNYLFGAGSNLNPRDTLRNPHVPYNESAPSYGKLFELKSTSMGIFGHNGSARFDQIKDGLGSTIAVGETLQVHTGGDRAAVVWGQGKLYGRDGRSRRIWACAPKFATRPPARRP